MYIDRKRERDPEIYAIIGAAIEVHRNLGCGFTLATYWEAFVLELQQRAIPFEHGREMTLQYKGTTLTPRWRADFICYENILLVTRAQDHIDNLDKAQGLNYLIASGLQRGVMLNFGSPRLEYHRMNYGPQSAQDAAQGQQGGDYGNSQQGGDDYYNDRPDDDPAGTGQYDQGQGSGQGQQGGGQPPRRGRGNYRGNRGGGGGREDRGGNDRERSMFE